MGATAKPYCSYRMNDKMATALDIKQDVQMASVVACVVTVPGGSWGEASCEAPCCNQPPRKGGENLLCARASQVNELCDYPAGRRFQPLTLALDNLTACASGALCTPFGLLVSQAARLGDVLVLTPTAVYRSWQPL